MLDAGVMCYAVQVQLRVFATQQRHLPPLFRGQLIIYLWLFPLACPGSVNRFNRRPAAIPTAAVVLFFFHLFSVSWLRCFLPRIPFVPWTSPVYP